MEQTKTPFKVIIAGTRTFSDYDLLCRKCDEFLQKQTQTHSIVIVSGTARGADRLGERYAAEHGYSVERYPANWNVYGKAAGYIRNSDMANASDALICFWDGQSRGSGHMIDLARKKGLSVRIFKYTNT